VPPVWASRADGGQRKPQGRRQNVKGPIIHQGIGRRNRVAIQGGLWLGHGRDGCTPDFGRLCCAPLGMAALFFFLLFLKRASSLAAGACETSDFKGRGFSSPGEQANS